MRRAMGGMSSRGRGICLVRRWCATTKGLGPEIGQCEKDEVVMVGKPDKMACRSAPQSQSRSATSLQGDIDPRLQFARPPYSTLAIGLLPWLKCCFVAGQVLPLLRVADEARCSAWPLLGWAGCTAGFLSTPLLVCTAVSRGKDDHYRGVFPCRGGEFYFWWSEFWTVEKKEGGPSIPPGLDQSTAQLECMALVALNCSAWGHG